MWTKIEVLSPEILKKCLTDKAKIIIIMMMIDDDDDDDDNDYDISDDEDNV